MVFACSLIPPPPMQFKLYPYYAFKIKFPLMFCLLCAVGFRRVLFNYFNDFVTEYVRKHFALVRSYELQYPQKPQLNRF